MPETARSKPLEIWFQDEARVGQQGTLTRIWAERGTRPRAPRDTRYIWSYIFGAVCPERAEAAALIMPHADTQAMSAHLAEIAKTVASGAHALLILDGAGWHGSAELEVPDNITLLKLPPYSPELNPMENVWAYLRANKLAISVFDNYEQIVDRCCEAWNFFANDKTAITSITTRQWPKRSTTRAVGMRQPLWTMVGWGPSCTMLQTKRMSDSKYLVRLDLCRSCVSTDGEEIFTKGFYHMSRRQPPTFFACRRWFTAPPRTKIG